MGKRGSKLSRENLRFLEQNTSFTRQEIRHWYRGFMKDCPDGQLTEQKFMEVYCQFFPEGKPDQFCRHVFRSFDKDGSGSIEFKEFLLAINITSNKGNPEDKLKWAFNMYDIDGNGTIEKGEMELIIKAIYDMLGTAVVKPEDKETPKDRTARIFDKMDSNNDGVLTREEFIHGCLNDQCLYEMLTADAGSPEDLEVYAPEPVEPPQCQSKPVEETRISRREQEPGPAGPKE
ncbi:neuronal calcium sensor 2-like [Babylonia areolata]|uniref:neuronal calcium sensor 2-like n=1 Tax=Babylonia areolata TaxID=304850 RepID=UPI003FD5278B